MKTALLVLLLTSGCAQAMPKAGAALQEVSRDYYTVCGMTGDQTALALRMLAADRPEIAAEIETALKTRGDACGRIKAALNILIEIYSEANEAVKP